MPETTRTFIAIPVPDAIGSQLARWQHSLGPQIPSCRWDETRPFHLTLAFLGDVDNSDLNSLCRAVASAVESSPRFELNVVGVGAFPGPERPRVVWAGVQVEDPAPLTELRTAVVRAATQAGYRPDDDRFHPHITLGRIKPDRRSKPHDLTNLLRREQVRSGGRFRVDEIITYSSVLDPGGPTYAPLGRARLLGKKDESPH